MATKIVTKNSSTASAVPTASDLVQGELAVNVADKRLFTEDNGGSIVELGTNPSTIDIDAGSIDGTAIGASSASTGAFTTLTASGIDVTGTATMDGLTVDGAYTDVKFKTTQGRLDLWLTDTDTTEGQVRVRGDANNLVFITDTTERMRIDSSGKVGIGTSSPVYSLDVRGEAGIELYNASGGGDVLNLRPSLGDANKYNMSISSYDHSGGGVGPADGISINAFDGVSVATGSSTARQERMRIDSSGNVGIGTTSVNANIKLQLEESDTTPLFIKTKNSAGSLIVGNNSAGNSYVSSQTSGKPLIFETVNSERARIDSSGNLLVGKTSTSATTRGSYIDAQGRMFNAQPNGASPITFQTTSNGTTIGSISVTASATSYNTSSDQRLKENITDADDAGSKVDAIQVRQYDWKADGSHQDYGMIAQELQAVAPEAVSGNTDSEEMMGVDYSKLVPMLIKEIQSLRNRVAQLEE